MLLLNFVRVLHKQGPKLRIKQRFPAAVGIDEDLPTTLQSIKEDPLVDVIAHLTSKNSLHIMLASKY